ncbi:MAG: hypothetical protein QOD75_1909 [Blastocatellia bacterium]|jgi:hypothetical protein|nr:hypothetical protein [Blastocatellia bacterium]
MPASVFATITAAQVIPSREDHRLSFQIVILPLNQWTLWVSVNLFHKLGL